MLSPSILLPKDIFLYHLSDHQIQISLRSLFFPECRFHEATNLAVFSITIYVMSRTMPVIWLALHTYVCENQILCIFHLGDRMNTDIMTLRDRHCEIDSDDESLN